MKTVIHSWLLAILAAGFVYAGQTESVSAQKIADGVYMLKAAWREHRLLIGEKDAVVIDAR